MKEKETRKKKKPLVLGITGGIGSGKSKIVDFLSLCYPVRVIKADNVGHELMAIGKPSYRALLTEYGPEILGENKEIDREKLKTVAFATKKKEKRLNAITHPLIKEEIKKRISRTKYPVVLLEAALLFEGELDTLCDKIIFIQADKEDRFRWLSASRGLSPKDAEKIMRLQASDEEFMLRSDAVIKNEADFSKTEKALNKKFREWKIAPKKEGK